MQMINHGNGLDSVFIIGFIKRLVKAYAVGQRKIEERSNCATIFE